MDNPYQTLEVDPHASEDVLSAAYHTLAKKYSDNEKQLKRINEAKEIVLDSAKRRQFDRPPDVKKGKVIGGYRIVSEIAEGGFGKTYKAEHIATGRPVCIKHASEISAADEALLMDEAKACWDLRHWGIPCMRDILRMPDNSLALVMSYVPGPTLAEILMKKEHQRGLDPEHVYWMVDRSINILKYLHFHGVVHGDVKPQNLIIQPESHAVVLVDYGLSRVKPTRSDQARGYTPFFAAPEQIAGKVPLPESDLYGLGMTMIFALGGDVEKLRIPEHTPSAMEELIVRFVKREVLSRPNWDKEDLCETVHKARMKDYGRAMSGLKPLKV